MAARSPQISLLVPASYLGIKAVLYCNKIVEHTIQTLQCKRSYLMYSRCGLRNHRKCKVSTEINLSVMHMFINSICKFMFTIFRNTTFRLDSENIELPFILRKPITKIVWPNRQQTYTFNID